MNTTRDLFFILVSAALTSAWWAVAMFAHGDNQSLFAPGQYYHACFYGSVFITHGK